MLAHILKVITQEKAIQSIYAALANSQSDKWKTYLMHNLSSNAMEKINVLTSLKWGFVEIHDKVWKTNLLQFMNNDLSANDKLLLSVFCRKNIDFVSHFKFLPLFFHTLWLAVRGISSNVLQITKRIWKHTSTQAESSLFRTHYTMWGQQWWVEDSQGFLS